MLSRAPSDGSEGARCFLALPTPQQFQNSCSRQRHEVSVMTFGSGRLATLACALFALTFLSQAQAAPASAFGPEVPIAEPRDGFVGSLDAVPDHGPAGTPI